ncbi:MAG: hypothetical protein IT362_04190 [Deltaproteobacteria bacterium]|nr:hypothetical protein [Deltaproteobacteria bacterium]
MYIEVLHDNSGKIKACYCSDTLPTDPASPILAFTGIPQGLSHARLNIDTLTAIEIENGSVPKAVIDQATGQARIEEADRTRFVMDNFEADLTLSVIVSGVSFVGVRRKAQP